MSHEESHEELRKMFDDPEFKRGMEELQGMLNNPEVKREMDNMFKGAVKMQRKLYWEMVKQFWPFLLVGGLVSLAALGGFIYLIVWIVKTLAA